jgi:hypothetical protein
MFLTKIFRSIILGGSVILFACATNPSLVTEEDVTIERVDSRSARIILAYLETSGTEMVLRGELQRRSPGRGPISGHLHIELIAPDGAVFKEASIGYKRLSVKSRIANFHIEIPGTPSDIKTIRIVHHDS